jgi:hypothetical protein
MEQVVDALLAELDELSVTDDFKDIMFVPGDTKFDDPGLVVIDEYPYIYVAPINDEPSSETMGLRGYDIRRLTLQVGVVVNAADFFDPTVSELPATRELVQASNLIRRRLRRLSKRNLDDLSGVRSMVVNQTNYVPDMRENVFVRVAVTTITVEKQYQHEE